MKKLATILLGLLTLLCLFSFTACGDKKQNDADNSGVQPVTTTVTQEQWNSAFAFFDKKENYNFTIKMSDEYKSEDFISKSSYVLSVNYDKKIRYGHFIENSNDGSNTSVSERYVYMWQNTESETYICSLSPTNNVEPTGKCLIKNSFDDNVLG